MKTAKTSRPSQLNDFSFEDLYAEISQAWEKRAKELQARRWAKIKARHKEGLLYDKHSAA